MGKNTIDKILKATATKKAATIKDTCSHANQTKSVIRLGTDFSGLDGVAYALKSLGIPFSHGFASDTDKRVRRFLRNNHSIKKVYKDVKLRDINTCGGCDLYAAGAPCVDYSTAGKMKGAEGALGMLSKHSIQYIMEHTPKVVLLENVPGLRTVGRAFHASMHRKLKKAGYEIHEDIYNTIDHGLPQHRRRLYVIALRADSVVHPFSPPKPLNRVIRLKSLLDKPNPETDGSKPGLIPDYLPDRAQRVIKKAFKTAKKDKVDLGRTVVCVDHAASDRPVGGCADCDPPCKSLVHSACPLLAAHPTGANMLFLPRAGSASANRRLRCNKRTLQQDAGWHTPRFTSCPAALLLDFGRRFAHHTYGYMCCVTKSRGHNRGYWNSLRSRRFSFSELARVQGYNMDEFNMNNIPPSAIGSMIGNTMSACVLERITPRALCSTGLVDKLRRDEWAAATAQLGSRRLQTAVAL